MTIYYGTVCWFSPRRGFGFIAWEKDGVIQRDIFIHWSDISPESCEGFKTLHKSQKVSFNIGTNHHGDPKAIDVLILKN